ncbi:MAG: cache domain-containing protein [Deltaproteobacteria bacterium]|nr:cache domain-containing protein [Deltaproteobacteria bacterium]
MFKNMRLGVKLAVAVLVLGVVPFVVIGIASLTKSTGALSRQVFDQLEGLREIKKAQIVRFFENKKNDMATLVHFVEQLREEDFRRFSSIEASKRRRIEDFLAQFVKEHAYYDLLLIHPRGEVVYSVAREPDLGSNMIEGEYAGSGLGRLVRKVMETGRFGMADFEPYAPSGGEPAAFIAQPVTFDGNSELIVALQLSIEAINNIMQERVGMGRTGETYLVGEDKLMRSDSFLDPVHRSLKASFAHPETGKVDTEAGREALAGRSGEKIITDYNGNPVLSAYAPIHLWDVTWALIAEMDVAEAFEAINKLTWVVGIVAVLSVSAIIGVGLLIVLLLLNRTSASRRG